MYKDEELVFTAIREEIAKYRIIVEKEFALEQDLRSRMRLQSTYWVEDLFPLVYNEDKFNIDHTANCESRIRTSAIVLKVYKVFMSLRLLSINGWTSNVVDKIINDISRRVFNNDALFLRHG